MTDSVTTVYASTRFEALHHWPGAPEEVGFLADPHRHEFHVTVSVPVRHANRDIEFILLKRFVDSVIREYVVMDGDAGTQSCEQMAATIKEHVEAEYDASHVAVSVSEDGENGATISPRGQRTEDA